MSRLILIALILLTVAGLHPAPVTATESQTIENCWHNGRLRPVPGRWYKVASRIDDDWTDGFGRHGEPHGRADAGARNAAGARL